MAPKRRSKGGGSSKSKKPKANPKGTPLTFEKYVDEDEGVITMEGLSQLSEELGIDASTDTKLLVLCWRLGASKPGVIQSDEWKRLSSCERLPTAGTPTLEKLKSEWDQLDPAFLENSEFRPFFKFCFEFNREGTKKFLERDTAIALLPLCIENRSVHTKAFVAFLKSKPDDFKLNKDQWCSFLDFSLAVGKPPEFKGWDADESSWPILLDEFVEYSKK